MAPLTGGYTEAQSLCIVYRLSVGLICRVSTRDSGLTSFNSPINRRKTLRFADQTVQTVLSVFNFLTIEVTCTSERPPIDTFHWTRSANSTFRHPNVYSITVLQPWSNQNFFLGVRFWGFSLNFVLFSYSLGFFYSQRFIGGLKPPINTHTVTASYQ